MAERPARLERHHFVSQTAGALRARISAASLWNTAGSTS
jgi:hypothetical protein